MSIPFLGKLLVDMIDRSSTAVVATMKDALWLWCKIRETGQFSDCRYFVRAFRGHRNKGRELRWRLGG